MWNLSSAISFARADDPKIVRDLLGQAVEWMLATPPNQSLWPLDQIELDVVTQELDSYYLGRIQNRPVVTFMLNHSDELYWPDTSDSAIYIHRIAVARQAAATTTGASVLPDLFNFVADVCRQSGKALLRLDCDKTRPALARVYERCGFVYHSDIELPNYLGARYERCFDE